MDRKGQLAPPSPTLREDLLDIMRNLMNRPQPQSYPSGILSFPNRAFDAGSTGFVHLSFNQRQEAKQALLVAVGGAAGQLTNQRNRSL